MNEVNYEDFRNILFSVSRMWSAATGQHVQVTDKLIEDIFSILSDEKGYFNVEDYIRVM